MILHYFNYFYCILSHYFKYTMLFSQLFIVKNVYFIIKETLLWFLLIFWMQYYKKNMYMVLLCIFVIFKCVYIDFSLF